MRWRKSFKSGGGFLIRRFIKDIWIFLFTFISLYYFNVGNLNARIVNVEVTVLDADRAFEPGDTLLIPRRIPNPGVEVRVQRLFPGDSLYTTLDIDTTDNEGHAQLSFQITGINEDFHLPKIDYCYLIRDGGIELYNKGTSSIEIKLLDILGRKHIEKTVFSGSYKLIKIEKDGLYFLLIRNNGEKRVDKIIKEGNLFILNNSHLNYSERINSIFKGDPCLPDTEIRVLITKEDHGWVVYPWMPEQEINDTSFTIALIRGVQPIDNYTDTAWTRKEYFLDIAFNFLHLEQHPQVKLYPETLYPIKPDGNPTYPITLWMMYENREEASSHWYRDSIEISRLYGNGVGSFNYITGLPIIKEIRDTFPIMGLDQLNFGHIALKTGNGSYTVINYDWEHYDDVHPYIRNSGMIVPAIDVGFLIPEAKWPTFTETNYRSAFNPSVRGNYTSYDKVNMRIYFIINSVSVYLETLNYFPGIILDSLEVERMKNGYPY